MSQDALDVPAGPCPAHRALLAGQSVWLDAPPPGALRTRPAGGAFARNAASWGLWLGGGALTRKGRGPFRRVTESSGRGKGMQHGCGKVTRMSVVRERRWKQRDRRNNRAEGLMMRARGEMKDWSERSKKIGSKGRMVIWRDSSSEGEGCSLEC